MKCKRDNDARSIDHHSLELMRQKAVTAARNGVSVRQIADAFGINVRSVYRWLANYARGGQAALLAKDIPGRPPKINQEQLKWLAQVLIDKTPLHFKLDSGLWSLALISEVLQKELAIKLSQFALGRVMKLIGLPIPKPLQHAWRQNPQLLDEWLNNVYPDIRKKAKRVGAQIYFTSEGEMEPRSFTPKAGSTQAERSSVKIISAVSPTGNFRFMLNDGNTTSDTLIEFLTRLLNCANKPVYLIVDKNRAYYSVKVKNFIQNKDGKLKVFFITPREFVENKSQQVRKLKKTQILIKRVNIFLFFWIARVAQSVEFFLRSIKRRTIFNQYIVKSLK